MRTRSSIRCAGYCVALMAAARKGEGGSALEQRRAGGKHPCGVSGHEDGSHYHEQGQQARCHGRSGEIRAPVLVDVP